MILYYHGKQNHITENDWKKWVTWYNKQNNTNYSSHLDLFHDLYFNEELSTYQISNKLGLPQHAIWRELKNNFKLRGKNESEIKYSIRRSMTDEDTKNYTVKELSAKYDCSYSRMTDILRDRKLPFKREKRPKLTRKVIEDLGLIGADIETAIKVSGYSKERLMRYRKDLGIFTKKELKRMLNG